jgi:DNA-directed RNA polymerase specialized sigma24 family protein
MVLHPLPSSPPLRLVRLSDEADLVARCIAADPAAQRALFERERRRVHALFYRMVGSNAPMDDLLQETFLQVFRSLPTFRGESSLRTWIDRCAVRVAYAYFGRKPRTAALECVQDVEAETPNAEELFAIENRSLREVAEIMESTLATAKIRVWRARRTLEERAKKDPLLSEFFDDGLAVARDDR